MFDHVGVVVSNLERGQIFYTACLRELGFALLEDHSTPSGEGWLVYGPANHESFFVVAAGRPSFWTATHEPSRSPVHVAFRAPAPASVRAFHRAGLTAGGKSNGEPGPRRPARDYYAAFLFDPDGNNVEAGFRGYSEDH